MPGGKVTVYGTFPCPHCKRTFKLQTYLNRHELREHAIDSVNEAINGPAAPNGALGLFKAIGDQFKIPEPRTLVIKPVSGLQLYEDGEGGIYLVERIR